MRDRNGEKAFTLIEIMIVLAVLGVLAAIAGPSFRKSVPRVKLRSAAQQLASDLQLTRLKCISGNYKSQIVFNTGTSKYTRYLDSDRDGTFESGEEDITNRTLPKGISFVVASTAANVTFDPTGTADDGSGLSTDITVTLTNTNSPPDSRQITVNRTMGIVKLD